MPGQNLFKKLFIYGIGNVSVAVANFFFVPFYTFYLSTQEYGIYDLIISTTTLLLPLITLHVELALLRWLLSDKTDSRKALSNAIVLLLCNIFVFALVFFILMRFIQIRFGGWIFLFAVTLSFYSLLRQYIRGIGKNVQYVLADIIYLLTFLLQVLVYLGYIKMTIKGLLMASVFAYIFTFLYLSFYSRIWMKFSFRLVSASVIREFLKYSIPLIPNTINLLLMGIVLKYIIAWTIGIEYNGLFAVAFKFASLLFLINTVFYLAWQEMAIQTYANPDSSVYFTRVLNIYLKIMAFILIAFVSVQYFVLPALVAPEYHSVTFYIPLLLLGNFFMVIGNFYGVIYQCELKTRSISFSSLTGTFVTLVIAIVFARYAGMYAILIAYASGNFALFLYRIIDTKKYLRVDIQFLSISIVILFSIFMTVLQHFAGTIWMVILGCTITILFIACHYRIILHGRQLILGSLKNIKMKY